MVKNSIKKVQNWMFAAILAILCGCSTFTACTGNNDRSATEETLGSSKNQEEGHAAEDFLMELNHWEYNDKKGHVKFYIDNYATGHYYMDEQEWKEKKKSMKVDYSNKMTLDQLDSYATSHNIPALSSATRQAVSKLKQW